MRQRKMCKGQQMKAITADSRGSCMNLLNADAAVAHCRRAAGQPLPPRPTRAAHCRRLAPLPPRPPPPLIARAGLAALRREASREPRLPLPIRHPCRRAAIAPPPAPSHKVKAASYDNILLRRCTGARKPALPMREAWPRPDHRKTRFYTWQSFSSSSLGYCSGQHKNQTLQAGFPFSTVLAVVKPTKVSND